MKPKLRNRYEPLNLDLASFLSGSEKKHLDRYGYVIDHLYQSRFLDNGYKHLKEFSKAYRKKRFIPLNAVLLRKILHKDHSKRILSNLIEWGIIETDNQYIPGQKSRSYCLTSKYVNSTFRAVPYSKKFSDRLDKLQEDIQRTRLSSLHRDIAVQLEKNFTIDMGVARRLLKTLHLDKFTDIRTRLGLDRMQDGDFGHKVSPNSARYFNHLVNMKRELRQAVVCKTGEELLEVDIANSQPFFLSFFIAGLIRNTEDIINVARGFKIDVISLQILISGKEYKRFEKMTVSGHLYDYFSKKEQMERDVVKDMMFQTFFKRMNYTIPFEENFKKLFPKVYEVIVFLKPINKHNRLALLLQRLESMVVIETLCDLMVAEEIPFIPIHDSVIVPRSRAQEVAKAFQSTSYYYSRLKPTVRIKTLEGKVVANP
jgi:hypothetical protein